MPNGDEFVGSATQAGFDAERLRRLHSFLADCTETLCSAGVSVLIERSGRLAYRSMMGMSSLELNRPMAADTLFRIYSMSKPITSVAALALFEEGKFLLTDPVRSFLPEIGAMQVYQGESGGHIHLVPQTPDMTITDLLGHTSGLIYGSDEDNPVDRMWADARLFRRDGVLADVLTRLADLPLRFQPGTQFEYGISHDVLGALLERVENKPLSQILSERVFDPLDMTSTGFEVPLDKLDKLSTLYGAEGDRTLQVLDPPDAGSRWAAPVSLLAGGEGLVSSMNDLHHFVSMLYGQGTFSQTKVISRKSVELMTANRLGKAQRANFWMAGYGFGLGVGVLLDPAANSNLGSSGEFTWAGSASTFFWVDPKEELFAILLMQREPSSSHTMARTFKALMYQALT